MRVGRSESLGSRYLPSFRPQILGQSSGSRTPPPAGPAYLRLGSDITLDARTRLFVCRTTSGYDHPGSRAQRRLISPRSTMEWSKLLQVHGFLNPVYHRSSFHGPILGQDLMLSTNTSVPVLTVRDFPTPPRALVLRPWRTIPSEITISDYWNTCEAVPLALAIVHLVACYL